MRSRIASRLLISCTLFFSPNPRARSQCLGFSKSSSALQGFVTVGTAAAEEFVKGSVHPNGVAVIPLDRPKALNAMNLDMDKRYKKFLDEWEVDPLVKCVLVEGSSSRAFSAVMDIEGVVAEIQKDKTAPLVRKDPHKDVGELLVKCCSGPESEPQLKLLLPQISWMFGPEKSVNQIIEELKKHELSTDAKELLRHMEKMTMICARFSVRYDFAEGVQAVLVDKDQMPKWNPSSLEEVDLHEVEAVFASLNQEAEELRVSDENV